MNEKSKGETKAQLLTKREAADYLGISTRAVERLQHRGALTPQYRVGAHGREVVFSTDQLDKARAEREAVVTTYVPAPSASKATPDKPTALARRTPSGLSGVTDVEATSNKVSRLLRQLGAPDATEAAALGMMRAGLASKLLLDLAEVQALTGLSRAFLTQAITEGRLRAIKIGKAWRIKRADLEKFVAKL